MSEIFAALFIGGAAAFMLYGIAVSGLSTQIISTSPEINHPWAGWQCTDWRTINPNDHPKKEECFQYTKAKPRSAE